MPGTLGRRRALALLALGVLLTALPLGFGHRGVHAVRSLILPGAGLYDHRHVWLGVAFTVAAIAATCMWLAWGADWMVALVLVGSMAASAALAYTDHPVRALQAAPAAHEFPLVAIVMGALSSLRLAWRRSALGRRMARRRGVKVAPLDACRAASISALAGGEVRAPLDEEALRRRCRRVGAVARGRFGGDPLRIDHAHARTALALTGGLDDDALERFCRDASACAAGVPASEPGWVRLLDGTVAALALERLGDDSVGSRWASMLDGPLSPRRHHRPGSTWTPLGLRGPKADAWEHAASTALARSAGWVGDDDWMQLRTRALAAAARGNAVADDERLVAAARIWLRLVDDPPAQRILARVTVHRDPLAVALQAFADSLPAAPPPSGAAPEHTSNGSSR